MRYPEAKMLCSRIERGAAADEPQRWCSSIERHAAKERGVSGLESEQWAPSYSILTVAASLRKATPSNAVKNC